MLKRYLHDTSGQFAIMFSVCVTMLIFGMGAAVDLAAMQKERSQLQSMTDSAVLAAAALKTDKLADLKKASKESIDANNFDGLNITTTTTLDGNDIIEVVAKTTYKTQLMGIVGIKSMPVGARSSAPVPKETPLNIALVLDTTDSMSGANMTALQAASKKLLEVFDSSDPGTIQAGVIPFGEYVNVGLANRNRPWMDVPDDSTTTGAETCYMTKDKINPGLCTTVTTPSTCYNDSGPYDCTSSSTSCPPEAYGPEYETCYTPTSTQTWNGCVGSRDDPDHKDPDYKGKKFPGLMNETCGSEILDLTTNMATVEAHIDNLITDDWTYIPAGLAWGWRMLDPDIPYGGLTNSQSDRKRALILMSDGANSVKLDAPKHRRHYGPMTDSEIVESNQLTSELCTGIKNAGIELFSVAYNLPTAEASAEQMIENCATSSSHFFSAANQTELEQAFEDIAKSLYEVRIIK